MKAVVIESYGATDVLELRNVEKPTPKAGEVLVRVRAASGNDWRERRNDVLTQGAHRRSGRR